MKWAKFGLIGIALTFISSACTVLPSVDQPADNPVNGSALPERVLGTVEFYGEPIRVEVPKLVEQRQPFVVTVTTYGGGCVEKGETKVEVEVLRAEVRPYDYDISPTLPANGLCTDELRFHEHVVTVSFVEAGSAEIVFFGRKKNANGFTQTSVTRTLTVH